MADKRKPTLKRWNRFASEVLKDKAMLFVDGKKPDKIFHVCTFDGAKKALEILTKLKVRKWVMFSVQGFDKSIVLMATAMLVQDLTQVSDKEPVIYSEGKIAYLDGSFPDTCGKPDKDEWKAFILEVKK